MAKYEYSTTMGSYDDPVRLTIELRLQTAALSKDEYDRLNAAFDTIEEIALGQQELNAPVKEEK